MAIDRQHLGYRLPAFTVPVTAGRIAAFRAAIGCADTGTDTPAPPTFMKAVEGEDNSTRRILDALGVDLKRVLHAEQQFEYRVPIRAGDTLRVLRCVAELYERKQGAMEFIVIESSFTREADGTAVGTSRQVVLVRNPQAHT